MYNSRFMISSAVRGVRNFSAANSHVPPKKVHGIVGRYASAVYTSASKIGELERVENELKSFADVIKKNASFAAFLNNPTVPRQEKVTKVGSVFDEKTFSHVSRNLLLTLCANGRIDEFDKVQSTFDEIMQASRGATKITIISAEALAKKQLEKIQASLVGFVGAGKPTEVVTEVNPDILGGLQVMIGDRFLDLSVASRVSTLAQALEVR